MDDGIDHRIGGEPEGDEDKERKARQELAAMVKKFGIEEVLREALGAHTGVKDPIVELNLEPEELDRLKELKRRKGTIIDE